MTELLAQLVPHRAGAGRCSRSPAWQSRRPGSRSGSTRSRECGPELRGRGDTPARDRVVTGARGESAAAVLRLAAQLWCGHRARDRAARSTTTRRAGASSRATCAPAAHESELAVKKRACLDASLDRMQAIGDVLDTATTEVIDHATEVVATLPELADCAEPKALLGGPSAAPSVLAGVTAELTSELDALSAQQAVGSTHTLAASRSVLARAERLGWGPAIARGHVVVGTALALAYQPALDELVRGAELGIASHLDRDAVHAWIRAFAEAAYESKADTIEMLATAARSTTARMGDPALALQVEIAYARALIQSQRWDEGLSICRPAIATAEKLGDTNAASSARDCLFEGLSPAGKLDELREVAAERVATASKRLGPDAPALATYHLVLADFDATNGNVAAGARRDRSRARGRRRRRFPTERISRPPRSCASAPSVEAAEGNAKAAEKTLREALAIAKAITPKPVVTITDIETGLALLLSQTDPPAAQHAFEDAIATARAQSPSRSRSRCCS